MSLYDRPACQPTSVSSGLEAGDRSLVFSKLSKVLNQEDALGVPCLRGGFCSPQAPSRNAGVVWKGLSIAFDVTLPFAISESSF
jgi:hypothetical protein